MDQLLKSAKEGSHQFCKGCPWNPNTVGPIAFGVSCEEHGIKWSSKEIAISMQVVQDPAGTTPGKTGRLCFVHNSEFSSDKTARHAFDLWNASVSYDIDSDNDYYLRNHFWTNAMLHGADKENQKELRKLGLRGAREHCSHMLSEQISKLTPKIIIANGQYAVNSLHELGYLTVDWDQVRSSFSQGVYKETYKHINGSDLMIFCTYHTGITTVNTHAMRLYSSKIELNLERRMKSIKSFPRIDEFINNYPVDKAEGKGMRVLLLHWLEIGECIREENKCRKA